MSILVASRPSGTLSGTLQDCALVSIDDAMALCHHLETIKQILEGDPRIAEYLDHKSENIAKAAKLIVEQSKGMYVLRKAFMWLGLTYPDVKAPIIERLSANVL